MTKLAEKVAELETTLKEERERHKIELRRVKRRRWCVVCSKLANCFCCQDGFYCSQECQQKHWVNGHHGNCDKKKQRMNLFD